MKLAITLLLISLGLGCGKSQPSNPGTLKAPPAIDAYHWPAPPRDGIAELKALAKKEGLYYRIWCADWEPDPEYQFQADLCTADCNLSWYEDGGRDKWAEDGPTQESAALRLVDRYPKVAHYFAPHLHTGQVHKGKQCPPEISGGPKDKP